MSPLFDRIHHGRETDAIVNSPGNVGMNLQGNTAARRELEVDENAFPSQIRR